VGGVVEVDEIRIGSSWEAVTAVGYGAGCLGTAIGRNGRAALGATFDVRLQGASPSQPAFLGLGASRTQWGALPLPFDLTAAGAPGCSVLAAFTTTASLATSASGTAAFSLAVPNQPTLLGRVLYLQWASVDAARTNRLPLAFSNAMEIVLER
jgi:hypothetical protein